MATPFRRSKSGIFYFRKAVPLAIRHLVGKTEEVISLGTSDPGDAKIIYLRVASEVQERWDALIAQRKPLDRKHILGLAGEFYRWFVAKHDRNPGEAQQWQADADRDRRMMRRRPGSFNPSGPMYVEPVRAFLNERGIYIDEGDLIPLANAAAQAAVHAKEQLARNAGGDYSPSPVEQRFPKWEQVEPEIVSSGRRLTLNLHWDAYVEERQSSGNTIKRWRPILEKLAVFAGTDDLSKVTTETMLKWKRALIVEGLSMKTIKDGYMAATRNFFEWAKENEKINRNPVVDVKVKLPKNYKESQGRAFHDHEARLILSEALRPKSGRTTDVYADARRWVPWLCAYTGARVNEITQLRREDVVARQVPDGDIWTIQITPEAGTVKTNAAREVPLHPHLIEQGFLKFVEKRKSGPLFYDPSLARKQKTANPQFAKVGNKIGEWVRDIGVTAPEVQPSHGWRHTFQQLAQVVRMDPEIRDAIKGHAPRTEGEKYGGNPPIEVKWREIQLLPRFPFVEPTGPAPKLRSHAKKKVAEGVEQPKPGRPPRGRRQMAEAAK